MGGQRPRDSHPLLLAARKLLGLMRQAIAQPDRLQGLPCHSTAFTRADAGIDQGQLHLSPRRGAGQQVEALKHEANLLVADVSQFSFTQPSHVLAIQDVSPIRRSVEATQHVHQRGLARARRPHDAHELALLDLQGDAPQRVDLDLAHLIRLGDVLDLYHHFPPPPVASLKPPIIPMPGIGAPSVPSLPPSICGRTSTSPSFTPLRI